jgi:4-amino-4-deoxy-L-arabinose transferase-like glycosyltransferase
VFFAKDFLAPGLIFAFMNQQKTGDLIFFSLISLMGSLLFLGGYPLWEGVESTLAESAREMALTGRYWSITHNFAPQPLTPPLMVWLQALSIQFFGATAWAVRLPGTLLSLASVLVLYLLSFQLRGRLFARLLAVLYLAGILGLLGGRLATFAPALNLFLILALFQLYRIERMAPDTDPNAPWAVGFWMALATLSAGITVFFVGILIYLSYKLWSMGLRLPFLSLLKGFLAWLIPIALWYGLQVLLHSFDSIWMAFRAQGGNLLGREFMHFMLPALAILLAAGPVLAWIFRIEAGDPKGKKLFQLALPWLIMMLGWVMLVPRQAIHGLALSGLVMPPMAILAALALEQRIHKQARVGLEVFLMTGLSLVFLGLFPAFINFFASNLASLISSLDGESIWEARLKQEVVWNGWEWLVGAVFLLGTLYNLLQLARRKYIVFVYLQLLLSLFWVVGSSAWIFPRLQAYSQGPVSEFCEKLAGQSVYVLTEGTEPSLALFYAQVKPYLGIQDRARLLEGKIDRDVYLIARIDRLNRDTRASYRQFEKLHEEGGYVFFRRTAAEPRAEGK